MVKIEFNGNGYLIEHKLLYWFSEPNVKLINLALEPWEDMRYQKLDYQLVDYPGEYDIDDITINCFLWKNNKLNYVIDYNNKKIWIIQSPEVLEIDEVGDVKYWLYSDDNISNKIDQMELEWEKQKLTSE